MKTYVLTISKRFPQTHKRKGEATYFPGQIFDHMKIHTIRANYDFWAKRIAEINKGKAVLSLRHWFDKPYRSPQIEFMQCESVGIEKLEFGYSHINYPCIQHGSRIIHIDKTKLAENDGLLYEDFCEWFNSYDLTKPMAIIHFTDFRYSNINGTPKKGGE